MNIFDQKLQESGKYPLKATRFSVLEANITYKCNLRCTHCYVEASPDRTEEMSKEVMDKIIYVLKNNSELTTVDITGGAPELNPNYKYFVQSCADMGKKVMVRSNLAIFSEPGMEDIPAFLASNKVKIIASLPCITEDGVDVQRGKGTYRKAIAALKRLNGLGYGKEGTGLELDLVFNPGKPGLAPDRAMLEKVYKEKLLEMHGITFNNLIALHNAPVGRLRRTTSDEEIKAYEKELQDKFNPKAADTAMCRHIVNVSYDGKLYDCDCNQMVRIPIKDEISTLDDFDYGKLSGREIVTTPVCFICTAGAGTTCLPSNGGKSECSSSASEPASSACCATSAASSQGACSSTATATAPSARDESDIRRLVGYEEVKSARVKEIFDQLLQGFHKVLPVYRVKSFVDDPEWMEIYHQQIMNKFTPKHLDYKTLMLIEFATDIAARWEYCIGGAYDMCLVAAGITPLQVNKTIKLVSACAAMSYLETGFDVFSWIDDEELRFIGLIDPDEVADLKIKQIYKEAKDIFGNVPEVYRVKSLADDHDWMQVFHSSIMHYFNPDVLDLKTIHLICVAALTVLQSSNGVRRHAKLALKAGAKPEEISEAIRGCYVNAYVFNTSAGFGLFKYSKE